MNKVRNKPGQFEDLIVELPERIKEKSNKPGKTLVGCKGLTEGRVVGIVEGYKVTGKLTWF